VVQVAVVTLVFVLIVVLVLGITDPAHPVAAPVGRRGRGPVALIFVLVLVGMLVAEVRCACPDGAGWDLSRPRPGLALTPADRPPGVSPLMEPRATPPDNVPIHPLAAEIFSRFFRTPNPGMCARPWRTHPAAIHWCVAMRGFRRTGLLPEAVPKMCIRPDSIAVRN
jgi:hypothetical protein